MPNITLLKYKRAHFATLSGLLLLSLASTSTGTSTPPNNFKGVSITDAQTTNTPPTAAFTYIQDGDTITFDASGSSDADGNITKYKWNFSKGTTREGVTTTYTATDLTDLQVTLTVIDNNNGVALKQQTINPTQKGIADDFSTNTSANYTKAYGTGILAITSGYAHLVSSFSGRNVYYHTTSLGSADQYIEYHADMVTIGDNAGVAFRIDPANKTTYISYLDAVTSKLVIRGFNLTNGQWVGDIIASTPTYPVGSHLVTISIIGTNIIATVDGNASINATCSTFSTGNYAGLLIYRDSEDPKIYDFKARAN